MSKSGVHNTWSRFAQGRMRRISSPALLPKGTTVSQILANESVKIPLDEVLPLLREHDDVPPRAGLSTIETDHGLVMVNYQGVIVGKDFGFGDLAVVLTPKTITFGRNERCVCCGLEPAWFGKTANLTPSGEIRYVLDMFSSGGETFTKDHVHPRAQGGSDELGNYVTCCRSCNLMKGKCGNSWNYIREVLRSTSDPRFVVRTLRLDPRATPLVRRTMGRLHSYKGA